MCWFIDLFGGFDFVVKRDVFICFEVLYVFRLFCIDYSMFLLCVCIVFIMSFY